MSLRSNNNTPRTEEGREPGKPHPDAQKNLEYALNALKGIEAKASLEINFYDQNEQGVIYDPKYVGFYWKNGPSNMGHAASFHVEHRSFMEKFDKLIEWLVANTLAKKKHSSNGAFR